MGQPIILKSSASWIEDSLFLVPPHLFVDHRSSNKTVLIGSLGQVIQEVLDYHQLDYEIFLEKAIGTNTNGTWDGILGALQNGEADMSTPVQIFHDRYPSFYLTNPIIFNYLTFLTKSPGKLVNSFTVFKAFTAKLWLLIVTFLMLMGLVMTLLDEAALFLLPRKHVGSDFKSNSYKRRALRKVTCLSFCHNYIKRTVTPQGFFLSWSCSPQRPLGICWSVFLLVVCNYYTSGLISRLTSPVLEPTLDTLQQLVPLVNSGKMVTGSVEGTIYDKVIQLISKEQGLQFNQKVSQVKTSTPNCRTGVKRVLGGEYAFVFSRIAFNFYMQDYGPQLLHVAEENLLAIQVGYPFPRKSIMAPVFYTIFRRFYDMGLVDEWLERDRRLIYKGLTDEELAKAKSHRLEAQKSAKDNNGDPAALGLKATVGVFVMFSLGVAVASASFGLETLVHYYVLSTNKRATIKKRRQFALLIYKVTDNKWNS